MNESCLSFYRVQEHGGETIIPFSAALEQNLADMQPDEVAKHCEDNKVQRLVRTICVNYDEHV